MGGGGKANSPSISITPLPGRGSPGSKGGSPAPTVKPGQPGAGQGGGKGNFVICEICDGYIKDLEQLRNHMQWIHKVKIHPKMIYNRPPLNCQKCQFRFFTDQGLERHLLGSHGLVTASMQDAANKGQDSGRSCLWQGLPVEAVEPRGQGPRQDPEARPPVLQMYRLYGHLRSVQAV